MSVKYKKQEKMLEVHNKSTNPKIETTQISSDPSIRYLVFTSANHTGTVFFRL